MGGIVGLDGNKIETGIIYDNLEEMKPQAVGEFVVCVWEEVPLTTPGGIELKSTDGTSGCFKMIVDNVGPECKLGINPGDEVMVIAPEMLQFPWSTKRWGIYISDQIRAVLVKA